MRFDFNEANILKQNLFSASDNKNILLLRLQNVHLNTKEPFLQKSVLSLIKKVECLDDREVKRIYYDIVKNRFIVTSNYKVVHKK